LAAVIINPRRYSAESPAPRIERRMRMILGRMRRRGFISEDDYLVAIGKPPHRFFNPFEWLFGSHPRDSEPSSPPAESSPPPSPEDTSLTAPVDSVPD
jgi:membrane peptidoglycan carboxypeptidase